MASDRTRRRREALLASAGAWLVRLLAWTWRFEVSHDDSVRALRAAKRPLIFAFWHGSLLPLLYHHRGQGVTVLISEHADGELIARIATRFGYRTVRGSSSRGAARALLALARAIGDGSDLAITPDGPRGPAKSIAPGTLIIAQRSHAPIVPVVVSAASAWRLRSWDAFMIPKPFTRVRVSYGGPLYVEHAATRDARADVERLADDFASAERRARA